MVNVDEVISLDLDEEDLDVDFFLGNCEVDCFLEEELR